MTVAKWFCKNCKKIFYTDGIEEELKPKCQCSWTNNVELIWVNFEPRKDVFDEIKASGCEIKRKFNTKQDAFKFTAHCLSQDDQEAREMLENLPF